MGGAGSVMRFRFGARSRLLRSSPDGMGSSLPLQTTGIGGGLAAHCGFRVWSRLPAPVRGRPPLALTGLPGGFYAPLPPARWVRGVARPSDAGRPSRVENRQFGFAGLAGRLKGAKALGALGGLGRRGVLGILGVLGVGPDQAVPGAHHWIKWTEL